MSILGKGSTPDTIAHEFLRHRKIHDRTSYLYRCLKAVKASGLYLEFGVYHGASITAIAKMITPRVIYGFDSFVGLPEPWDFNGQGGYEAGHFNLQGIPPTVPANVRLVVGWFHDTLPMFIRGMETDRIAFIHIDSDLYSSARQVLFQLNEFIRFKTVIMFDELCDWRTPGLRRFNAWREHEMKALCEWLSECNRAVEPIYRNEVQGGAFRVRT